MKKPLLALVLVTALGLAACGGSSESSSPEDQVRETLNSIADDIENEEWGNFCEHLSPDAEAEAENSGGNCEGRTMASASFISDEDIERMRNPGEITITGDVARMNTDGEEMVLVNVGGEWMIPASTDSGDVSE